VKDCKLPGKIWISWESPINSRRKGGCRVLFTRHYYEKVYLKVLADWPLLLMVLLYGKEMKESCAYSEPFLKER
jgi:hypothetical protein